MKAEAVCPVVTYGLGSHNDFRACDYRLRWPEGSTFRLESDISEPVEIFTRLVGRHMVYPVLAALAVAHRAAVPLTEAGQRLQSLRPVPMRVEPAQLPHGAWLLREEYKSGLETIEAALDLMARIPARRRFVIVGDVTEPPLGCGETYRRLGCRLAEVADQVIILSHVFRPIPRRGPQSRASRRSLG